MLKLIDRLQTDKDVKQKWDYPGHNCEKTIRRNFFNY